MIFVLIFVAILSIILFPPIRKAILGHFFMVRNFHQGEKYNVIEAEISDIWNKNKWAKISSSPSDSYVYDEMHWRFTEINEGVYWYRPFLNGFITMKYFEHKEEMAKKETKEKLENIFKLQ